MTKEDLRIVFMGTPDFACESLKALVENSFNVVGVFSKEDKPKGRGMELSIPPTKEYALSKNIPVYQPSKIKNNPEVMEVLRSWKPDLIVVVAYGKILPKEVLDFPRFGCINVHGSILPKYRGAAPIQWAIISGETETGVTTMYMDEGMDTGNMITVSKVQIKEDDTYETLHDKLAQIGARTLVEDLERLLKNDGVLSSTVQPNGYSLAPMITKENSKIDFNLTSKEICNLVRGTNPFPAAWCMLDSDRVYKIYEVKEDFVEAENAKIGEIVHLDDRHGKFIVKCKDGFVNILKLKAPGTRLMTGAEYIRGNKVSLHEVFI